MTQIPKAQFPDPTSAFFLLTHYQLEPFVPPTGHLLDFLHGRLLLSEGGHQHSAARGRTQSPAVVRHRHPGGLAHRRAHHVPPGQRLPRVHPRSRLHKY